MVMALLSNTAKYTYIHYSKAYNTKDYFNKVRVRQYMRFKANIFPLPSSMSSNNEAKMKEKEVKHLLVDELKVVSEFN